MPSTYGCSSRQASMRMGDAGEGHARNQHAPSMQEQQYPMGEQRIPSWWRLIRCGSPFLKEPTALNIAKQGQSSLQQNTHRLFLRVHVDAQGADVAARPVRLHHGHAPARVDGRGDARGVGPGHGVPLGSCIVRASGLAG